MEKYDLIVIGSGSGNSVLTPDWQDKKIAIIEAGVFGGTCLNKGCIPTKMYVYPATVAHESVADGPRLGVDTEFKGAHWRKMRDRIFGRINPISAAGRDYRAEEQKNVTLYEEHAEFIAPKRLRTASGVELTADQIVIAAGSSPVIPPIPGADLPGVHTSDTVMHINDLPENILVVGAGVIAAEFSSVFANFGSKITQIVRYDKLMRSMDTMIADAFTKEAEKQWELVYKSDLTELTKGEDGKIRAFVTGRHHGAEQKELGSFDLVLLATGRKANTKALNVAAGGYDTTHTGILAVDEYQRVLTDGKPADGVWALGDIASDHQLKHVANHEARIVAYNSAHPDAPVKANHFAIPAAVFSIPQIATVGLTSREAADQHGDAVVEYTQKFGDVAYGWAMEDTSSVLKVIADKTTNRLLGAHIVGHEASLLIHPLIQAMALDSDLREVARGQYWIHPALTEVIENAILGLGLEGGPL